MVCMSEDKTKTPQSDPTRDAIVAKIGTKATAIGKLQSKMDNLDESVVVYHNAIRKANNKIVTLNQKIETFTKSRVQSAEEKVKREAELVRMNELLEEFDRLRLEGESLGELMQRKIKEHEWYPGDPDEKRTALDEDEEYQKARKRKLEINDWMDDILGVVNRVFYSRESD